MQLNSGQSAPLRFFQDHVNGFVHKDPDNGRPTAHRRGDLCRLFIWHVARAFGVENQADRVDL